MPLIIELALFCFSMFYCPVWSSGGATFDINKLLDKLRDRVLQHSTCMWSNSFRSGHCQRISMGHHTSVALSFSAGSPQVCVLSLQLHTLITHDGTPANHSNTFVKIGTRWSRWRENNLFLFPKNQGADNRLQKIQTNQTFYHWSLMVTMWTGRRTWRSTLRRTSELLILVRKNIIT